MKLLIDAFDAITDWSASAGATINGVNDVPEYIAGNQDHSMTFGFTLADAYVQKTFSSPIDVTDYDELVVHIFSTLKGNNSYRSEDDFLYKIEFGVSKTYYMPNYSVFTDFTIDISDLTSLEYIKITALEAGSDYLVMSYMVATVEEIPLDIFVGIREQLQLDITDNYLTKHSIGAVTNLLGDTELDFGADVPFLKQHMAIRIDDGANSEIHLVKTMAGTTVKFGTVYDGAAMVAAHTAKTAYVYFPVEYGRYEKEIAIPGIYVWNFPGEPIPHRSDIEKVNDTWKIGDQIGERQVGRDYTYPIIIDCEARNSELLATASKIVRDFIARNVVWIDGKKFHVQLKSAPSFIEPTESYNIIPKMQYVVDIEIREDSFARSYAPKIVTTNLTFEVV